MSYRALGIVACVGSFILCIHLGPRAEAQEKPPIPSTTALSKFPALSGKLEQILGHEGGFIRPTVGEPFRLDLAAIANVEKLAFDPTRKSYIPLPGPLSVEAVHYSGNGGAFQSMRLVSRGEGKGRVVIDISPHGPKNHVRVWVVVESDVVQGVALIDCEAAAPFPGRTK